MFSVPKPLGLFTEVEIFTGRGSEKKRLPTSLPWFEYRLQLSKYPSTSTNSRLFVHIVSIRGVLIPEPSCPLPTLSNFGKAVAGQLRRQFGRKFSKIAVVILISPLAFGTGHFPCGKSDEGNRVIEVIRVFFRAPWSQVPTKNYCFTAFRVFALDAKFSVYGCKFRVHGQCYSHLPILR
jgi:hypothetical protein